MLNQMTSRSSFWPQRPIKGDPDLPIRQSPPTADRSVLTLKEIRDMVADMLEDQRRWLQYEGKSPSRLPIIEIADGTEGVAVPLDPAGDRAPLRQARRELNFRSAI
jgi:hypothetical protein